MSTKAIGITGNVTLPNGYNLEVRRGSLVLNQAPVDTTSTSDNGYETFLGGIKGGSGSAIGYPKYNGSGTAPGWGSISATPGSFTYTVVGSTNTYTANVLITNIRHSFDYKGNATVQFDFRTSGAISETWS